MFRVRFFCVFQRPRLKGNYTALKPDFRQDLESRSLKDLPTKYPLIVKGSQIRVLLSGYSRWSGNLMFPGPYSKTSDRRPQTRKLEAYRSFAFHGFRGLGFRAQSPELVALNSQPYTPRPSSPSRRHIFGTSRPSLHAGL